MRKLMNADHTKKTRRAFLGGLAISGLGALLVETIIGMKSVRAQDAKSSLLGTIKLADEKALAEIGGNVLLRDTAKGDILVVRSSDKGYSAMSNICPHKECKVKVKNEKMIQCPCHRSAYTLDGTYKEGPAKKNLLAFKVVEKNGVLTIFDN
jgi:Rieske Fe-S protein